MADSWVPDCSLDAGDDHVWVRPVTDCAACECCIAELCATAKRNGSTCFDEGGGNRSGHHPLDTCPCAPDIFGAMSCSCRWRRRGQAIVFTKRCEPHAIMCRALEPWELDLIAGDRHLTND